MQQSSSFKCPIKKKKIHVIFLSGSYLLRAFKTTKPIEASTVLPLITTTHILKECKSYDKMTRGEFRIGHSKNEIYLKSTNLSVLEIVLISIVCLFFLIIGFLLIKFKACHCQSPKIYRSC